MNDVSLGHQDLRCSLFLDECCLMPIQIQHETTENHVIPLQSSGTWKKGLINFSLMKIVHFT